MDYQDDTLQITATLAIPRSELSFRTSRSSGPGGQHVNKTETRVELLFDVANSPSLTDDQRARLLTALKSWLDNDGLLHLVSEQSRSQFRNRADTISRFVDLVHDALRPIKHRRPTRIPRGVKEARLQDKKQRGEIKRGRRQRPED
jgi:ribosome-associated protein